MSSASGAEANTTHSESGIGGLFRAYGERYIEVYQPDLRTIRLIRAIRVCRTPALGGKRLECADCGGARYIYFSCGNNHCPLCQGNKREQWQYQMRKRQLKVPYCHITFTLPHEFNGLCRLHPKQMYDLLFSSAWQTIQAGCADEVNVGGLPGLSAVLHTWGSDLKFHVHLHCMVTFGGWDDKKGHWRWPKRKDKLIKFRPLRNSYRKIFLEKLSAQMSKGMMPYHQSYETLSAAVEKKSWVVNHQPPTTDTEVINTYLSRYICRIGISDSRLRYDHISQKVAIIYNNYRAQESGQAAPKAIRELPPLVAMAYILQHLLPAHYHRSRHFGLHSASTYQRIADKLPQAVKGTSTVILVLIQIMKAMVKQQLICCKQCGSMAIPQVSIVLPDPNYKDGFLRPNWRAPPPPQRCEGGIEVGADKAGQ